MDAKEAKRLETLEKNLIKKFRTAEQEELKERAKKLEDITKSHPDKTRAIQDVAKSHTKDKTRENPLTVERARQLEQLQTDLQNQFGEIHVRDMEEQREREKKYEAITRAIKEKKEKDDLVEQKTKELLKKQKYNQLMKRTFRPSVSSTPERVGYIGSTQADDDEDEKWK